MLNLFPRFARSLLLCGLALWLSAVCVSAQTEPAGMLLYQEPATSYTEAFEYRSFRQDNALFATLVTLDGRSKKLKSGGVLAVLPYPPTEFDPYFAETAKTAIAKIETVEGTYPSVRTQLERARGKWVRALSVFQQEAERSQRTSPPPVWTTKPRAAPATSSSPDEIGPVNAAAPAAFNLTSRIEAIGRQVIGSSSRMLGLADRTFSVWTFFVILPALVIVLLLTVIFMAMRAPVTKLPPRRPIP